MISEYLSDEELYYSYETGGGLITLAGDEYKHLIKVMRHSVNDVIYVTNGKGEIYQTEIKEISKDSAVAVILNTIRYTDELSGVTMCLPYLKNTDRLEFALEKCTELGITSFIVYTSERTLSRSPKTERWSKILLSAMKQSLRCFLPALSSSTLKEISGLNGKKIIFDQNSAVQFNKAVIDKAGVNYLVIGPEGGLTITEISGLNESLKYKLAPNRLRSETAAITAASLLI